MLSRVTALMRHRDRATGFGRRGEWVAKTPGVEWPRGQEILSGILAMEPKTRDRMTTVRLIYIVITLHMLVGAGYIAWKEFGFMLPELP